MKPPEMEVFFSLLFFTNECLYYNIVNAVYGGCGEGVNTPGCEPGIRQFKSDHPPHSSLIISDTMSGIFSIFVTFY